VKQDTDRAVLGSRELLGNAPFFEKTVMPIVIRNFREEQPPGPDVDTCRLIQRLVVNEYLNEAQGRLSL
jgi:type I restriction enzyme R subunit